jgi:hypothetical protein
MIQAITSLICTVDELVIAQIIAIGRAPTTNDTTVYDLNLIVYCIYELRQIISDNKPALVTHCALR